MCFGCCMFSPSLQRSAVFAREMKFLVTPGVAARALDWASGRMLPDPHAGPESAGTYHIRSLYLDTPELSTYRKVGSYARAKFRVRRYNHGSTIFLERKLKTGGKVHKRRTVVDQAELGMFEEGADVEGWEGAWFLERVERRRLAPVCEVSYERTAFMVAHPSGTLRLTVDRQLHIRRAMDYGMRDGEDLVSTEIYAGMNILELKFRGELPGLFKELMELLQVEEGRVSKYRAAIDILGLAFAVPVVGGGVGVQV